MELKLVRGPVGDIAAPDQKGRVACKVGPQRVELHRELSSGAKTGEEILVGGELRGEVVHVLALKNFTRDKVFKVDFTFHILLAGLGGFLVLFGLFFNAGIFTSGLSYGDVVSVVLEAVGAAILVVTLRGILRINKLSGWVEHVDA